MRPGNVLPFQFEGFEWERSATQRFISGFYGLSCMPEAYKNVLDHTLNDLKNTHWFLIYIITVSRGSGKDLTIFSTNYLGEFENNNLGFDLPEGHLPKA